MKRVRMLLRVSSNQQLEADGDLSIQRQLVKEYIESQPDWVLDDKEYFEGSNSGYKNAVADRDVLQEALNDAKNREYDILVVYKDDRIGRLMWEIGAYIMTLKGYGVDIYTVKDGCISPSQDDIMGQIMLALRYGNAQKSSADTGMRVKDTAQKLVQSGKYMGGKAPYGYEFVLSGEISKHGRALHKLVIDPEKTEVVKHIFNLSLNKEYGSTRIAKELNNDDRYKDMAPNDVWKSGTISSILKNPIYAGYTAYKRRENISGHLHRNSHNDWILSSEANDDIKIIEFDTWERNLEKIALRRDKCSKNPAHNDVNVIKRNYGMLSLVDVMHCGCCGSKMVNGSKYSYWKIKATGEKRCSKIAIYKCQNAWQGVPHDRKPMYRADKIEPIIFESLASYIGQLQENEDAFEDISKNQSSELNKLKNELNNYKKTLDDINKKVEILEKEIPNAITGDYPLTLDDLAIQIKKWKEEALTQLEVIKHKEQELEGATVTQKDWESLRKNIPTWQEVFLHADSATKRVLVNRLVERIDVKQNEVKIDFKINLNDFLTQPRISSDSDTTQYRPYLK
ncbi:MAG: recombinase family protein [Lachnospiraceae bacterium]|nr:recombinase family protein [Lachnospiraceae bacterium]